MSSRKGRKILKSKSLNYWAIITWTIYKLLIIIIARILTTLVPVLYSMWVIFRESELEEHINRGWLSFPLYVMSMYEDEKCPVRWVVFIYSPAWQLETFLCPAALCWLLTMCSPSSVRFLHKKKKRNKEKNAKIPVWSRRCRRRRHRC